tara:strand:+ start:1 stop:1320 length:1320 start_codon:yes stop_codon:yes gene_type:complete
MDLTRKMSVDILSAFDTNNDRLPIIIDKYINRYEVPFSQKKRSKVTVNEIIRNRGLIDHIIEESSSRNMRNIQPKLKSILRLGCYDLLFDEIIPEFAAIHSSVELGKKLVNKKSGSMVNAVLRNMQRKQDSDPLWLKTIKRNNIELSFPNWLVKKWRIQFGETNTKKLCKSYIKKSPMFLRVDTNQLSLKKAINLLNQSAIEVTRYDIVNNFLKVVSGQDKVLNDNLFKCGIISIQDPASAAVAELVKPVNGDIILDVCAAPGTKSLLMAQKVGDNGKVFASDKDPSRVEIAKSDVRRHKNKNIQWSVLDATKDTFPMAEKILIDAPCTGTGVLGRRPDIKWRLKKKDFQFMKTIQLSILNHMTKFLKKGGKVVYATCSLEPEENKMVVNEFLSNNKNFSIIPPNTFLPQDWVNSDRFLMTMPYETGSDGLFGAVLQKK